MLPGNGLGSLEMCKLCIEVVEEVVALGFGRRVGCISRRGYR